MKKFLALVAAAILAAVIFAAVSAAELFLVGLCAVTETLFFIFISYIVFAAVSFGVALCAEKGRRVLTGKLYVLPSVFYIAVFLPSLLLAAVNLGLFLKRLNSGYYRSGFLSDLGRQIDQYLITSYCVFILLTAVFTCLINLYRRRMKRLDKQVEEYINEHKD